jgi:hypothetical protein
MQWYISCLDDLRVIPQPMLFSSDFPLPPRPDMVANATPSKAYTTLYLPWPDSRCLSSTSTSPPYWTN